MGFDMARVIGCSAERSLIKGTMIQQSNMSNRVKWVNSDPPSTILHLVVQCWELEVTLLSTLSFKWKVGGLLNKIVRASLMHDYVM